MLQLAETKQCPRCLATKPLELFYKRKTGKPTSRCKECNREYGRDFARNHPLKTEWGRRRWLRRYDLTQEEYDNILASQGGGCAICGATKPRKGRHHLPIDHNHSTGKVRGILCDKCNRALGLLDDNADLVIKAVLYLTNVSEK